MKKATTGVKTQVPTSAKIKPINKTIVNAVTGQKFMVNGHKMEGTSSKDMGTNQNKLAKIASNLKELQKKTEIKKKTLAKEKIQLIHPPVLEEEDLKNIDGFFYLDKVLNILSQNRKETM